MGREPGGGGGVKEMKERRLYGDWSIRKCENVKNKMKYICKGKFDIFKYPHHMECFQRMTPPPTRRDVNSRSCFFFRLFLCVCLGREKGVCVKDG